MSLLHFLQKLRQSLPYYDLSKTSALWGVAVFLFFTGCSYSTNNNRELAQAIQSDTTVSFVKQKAIEIVKTGFNAGDSYNEVWIRDYNTFIELACEVHPQEKVRKNLLVFFRMQYENGGIIDGFIPKDNQTGGYNYTFSDLEPRYAGHKNTVETDQETSLIQAVYKYIKKTGDTGFLKERVGEFTVAERLRMSIEFLKNNRFSEEYGLIWGATTADWGDVQPEHEWGVYLTEETHRAIDIYDNAMLLIALQNLAELMPDYESEFKEWHDELTENVMQHLWDQEQQKFIPNIYLEGSPFPGDFNENKIYQHGGTAIAIEAGLLSKDQIEHALETMKSNVKKAGAASIGLTLYPAYPEGFFLNPGMGPYSYQNGGDWTWFGGRMIQQLIEYGYVDEAYQQAIPFFERVKENDGFYEWYTVDNQPQGSGTFRGSAGVLYKVIELFEEWAEEQKS